MIVGQIAGVLASLFRDSGLHVPNCRAEYADRVTRGKSAFIYPNTQR